MRGKLAGCKMVCLKPWIFLNHPPFGERQTPRPRHDEMIQHTHIHQRQRLFQRIGEQAVGLARLGHAGGMIVREDGCCCIVMQGALHHLARVHAGLRERAVKQLFRGEHAMLRVEENTMNTSCARPRSSNCK